MLLFGMYDTIIYIPTILAYSFIILLVVILGFIVIYISHKIYTYIYDYMPIPELSASNISKLTGTMALKAQSLTEILPTTANGTLSNQPSEDLQTQNTLMRQKKTRAALKVTLNTEPCYLAYIVFETSLPIDTTKVHIVPPLNDTMEEDIQIRFIKYYDRLSSIPAGPFMNRCYVYQNTQP